MSNSGLKAAGAGTPQLTLRAVILAVVLAMILSAANAYLGLFAGLTIATAIPAAVVSMGVLRLLGGGTILENNIVQTGASAGSSIAAGVIFTIPALVILGYWDDFKYSWVLAIAGLGGLLGVLFSVPLRRSMIVEDPLPFPEGKAAAEVLKAGENPGPGLKILGISATIGALVKLAAESGLRMIPDNAAGAGFFGKYLGYMEAFFVSTQQRVTGEVHVLIRPGVVFVEGTSSRYSLMKASKGAYGESAGEWTAAEAHGFSKMLALPGIFYTRAGRN